MQRKINLLLACVLCAFASNAQLDRANELMDSIYAHYGFDGDNLLRENYPSRTKYRATYLASDDNKKEPNKYSYLWPFSGTLSAQAAIYLEDGAKESLEKVEKNILPGLNRYYDKSRKPAAYASYITEAGKSDRFYDDNIWLALDFADLYLKSGDKKWLKKSQEIWRFIQSGTDDKLGNGIYWCEQKKGSKNTCSNAPGTVLNLKLYQATHDKKYLDTAIGLYNWTKENLQDPDDGLFYDNINLAGKVDKRKYAYNSGQMLQAAALLYRTTQDEQYLAEAQRIAKSAFNHFFMVNDSIAGAPKHIVRKGDIWFTAVMMRGFAELFEIDGNREYVDAFIDNLDYAWTNARDPKTGLMNTDWTGRETDRRKWLLTQAAFAEMYARAESLNRR